MTFRRLPTISSRIRRTSADPFSVMQTMTLRANHDLAPVFARTRTHDVAKIFQAIHQAAGRRRGVTHLLGDGRHRQHFFLIKGREKKELGEGNVARREFLRETQDEAALHLEDDVGEAFGVRAKLVSAVEPQLGRGFQTA
jgi:hypothetical protein